MRLEKAVEELEKIVAGFIRDFSPDKIRRSLLTKTEINVLNVLAIAHDMAGNSDIAIKILSEIVVYIESKVYDREGFAIVYTKILYNLSRYVGMSGDDEEAVRLCDKGIKLCIRYNRFTYFANLLYNKGYGLMQMGKVEEAHKCIRECYYIESAMGAKRAAEMKITKEYADEIGVKLI